MGQGWFESDDDYQARMSQESNERRIEEATGSSPTQGWFESDESYSSRISLEANEATISSFTGSDAQQGWFESDSDYRGRVDREAHEATIESYSGSAAQQGWFENNDDYDHRVRHEANEAIVGRYGDGDPQQGWLEGDSDYRRRVSLEARERGSTRATSSSGGFSSAGSTFDGEYGGGGSGRTDYRSTYANDGEISGGGGGAGLLWIVTGIALLICFVLAGARLSRTRSTEIEVAQAAPVETATENLVVAPDYQNPSFRCRAGMRWIEDAICTSPNLAELDQAMSKLYVARRDAAEDEERTATIEGQRRWLTVRNACETTQDSDCVETAYRDRISELQQPVETETETEAVPVSDTPVAPAISIAASYLDIGHILVRLGNVDQDIVVTLVERLRKAPGVRDVGIRGLSADQREAELTVSTDNSPEEIEWLASQALR